MASVAHAQSYLHLSQFATSHYRCRQLCLETNVDGTKFDLRMHDRKIGICRPSDRKCFGILFPFQMLECAPILAAVRHSRQKQVTTQRIRTDEDPLKRLYTVEPIERTERL